jgi:hypothetical protein
MIEKTRAAQFLVFLMISVLTTASGISQDTTGIHKMAMADVMRTNHQNTYTVSELSLLVLPENEMELENWMTEVSSWCIRSNSQINGLLEALKEEPETKLKLEDWMLQEFK